MPHAGIAQPHYTTSIMDIHYMHPSVTDECFRINRNKYVLSCTCAWSPFKRGRVATQERRKRRRRRRGRKEGSEVSETVVHSTLPVSVCLPEQHSPTAQPRKGTRGGKRRHEERVKDTRTPRRINHHKKQTGNSR